MFEHTVLLVLLSVKLLLFEERVTRTWSIEHKHVRLKIPRGGWGGGGNREGRSKEVCVEVSLRSKRFR